MQFLKTYKKVERHIFYLIIGNLFLQLVNISFVLILNLLLTKNNFSDPEIGTLTSYRFAAALFFAFPFGLFIKGKALKPIFLTSSILLPIISLCILEAISYRQDAILKILLVFWGMALSANWISTIPYILRNADSSSHTESISLSSATWSGSLVICGTLVFVLSSLFPDFFSDKRLLQIFSCIGFISLFFILRLPWQEKVEKKHAGNRADFYKYDWGLIGKAVVPTFLIALGAGLAMPFMNLFFYHVFGIDKDIFSLLSSVTAILVVSAALWVPHIKAKWGYEAIIYTQVLAIFALSMIAFSDFLSSQFYIFALMLAIVFFIFRQPLMNLANPMISEMTMYYVGKKNQELISAVSSSIWSGSWFFSAQIFAFLRKFHLGFGYIFLITAALYSVGVLLYYFLVKDFRRREKLGLTG